MCGAGCWHRWIPSAPMLPNAGHAGGLLGTRAAADGGGGAATARVQEACGLDRR